MNYKYPLVNLITRGHIQVNNAQSCVNFINSLSDNAASVLYEQMLFIEDTKTCADFLNSVQESYELETGVISLPSNKTFMEQRDYILMKEDNDLTQQKDAINKDAHQILKWFKLGIPIITILKLIEKYDPQTRHQLIQNVGSMNKDLGEILNKSRVGSAIYSAGGVAKRMAATALTQHNHMTSGDMDKLKKAGIGTLIAAGVVTALMLISAAYKRYFSKEARQCKKYSGKQRTLCMIKARIAACKEAKKQAESALIECDKAKNPQDCRFKMRVEIRSWEKKKRNEEEKLSKLLRVNSSSFDDKKPKNDPFS